METKLCRICGKLGENNVHIFKTEGLKNKIETCLPIVVSQYCLLPDTICSECLENVENFYSFIKNCLQNIIVLEAQYDITESCLKTKRKHEKSSLADISVIKHDKNIQTDDDDCLYLSQCNFTKLDLSVLEKLDKALCNAESILKGKDAKLTSRISKVKPKIRLVNYENETDSNSDEEAETKGTPITEKVLTTHSQPVIVADPSNTCRSTFNSNLGTLKNYFDDAENNIINEIAQRKKRKAEEIGSDKTKIFKMDTNNKRKSKNPKKVKPLETQVVNEDLIEKCFDSSTQDITEDFSQKYVDNDINMTSSNSYQEHTKIGKVLETETNTLSSIPQVCLLCDMQFPGPSSLTTHVYETHGIDMAKVVASCPVVEEKKKKIPNLVKITDLKNRNEQVARDPSANSSFDVTKQGIEQPILIHEDPPQLQPSFVCPLCPAVQTSRPELFSHLRAKHAKQIALMCSLCFHMASTYMKLAAHLEICKRQCNIPSKYICKLCCYHDDNCKVVENHIPIHDFIITCCKKQLRIFDPSDYVEINPIHEGNSTKPYTCSECDTGGFATFKEFSTHRRSSHQIFHCDLCNKFYGRNSHLWKHVNRLHKGHPSITCQLCYKTSASKYHLAQHFNKIHSAKTYQFHDKEEPDNVENFMKKKFDGFDFQYVKQSFMRQELMEQDKKRNSSENSEEEEEDVDEKNEDCTKVVPPKEIDASSDLYTNIITNYTPPRNEGAYKCPKCFRGFHKKALLKKHKKNCRPRLQKDLLTRCKSCSRIFKDRQSLAKHLINYHSEYVCEICKQKVQSKCEIVSHIRFSHPNCHLFCHSCGNILRSKVDLAEHKKDHRNSFVCQFCGDMLPTKIKLKMHILSLHRKILSLSCGICLKLFETQHILRDHVQLVHKNHLSPLTSCTVCGKNYGSKWKTYDHLNKSHGRTFKACKMCLEVFDTEDDLRSHYDSMHANISLNNLNASNNSNSKVTASVSVNVENNPGKNNIKKEEFSSDLEGNNEDQEAKNSSSEISNDTDMYQQLKTSDCEDFSALADLPVQGEKISLLEKRLLGGVSQEVDKKLSKTHETTKPKNSVIKIEAKFVSYESPSNSNSKQPEEAPDVNGTSSLAPFSNSSKRTVYVNSNDPSVCEICLKTWPAKKHLWQHYIRCHKRVAATVCGICLKTNDTYEALQMHLITTHPTLLHGQGFGSNFICRICGRYHNASSKLKLHMAIHENFDWSLLDHFYPKNNTDLFEKDQHNNKEEDVDEEQEDEEDEEMDNDKAVINNGYNHENYVKEEAEDDEEVVNYESLIEQVEVDASSESESDCEVSNTVEQVEEEDEEANSVTTSDNESILSEENSLENRMLQNMLKEKEKLKSSLVVKQEVEDKEEREEEDEEQKPVVGGPFENLQKFYAESTKKLQKEALVKQEKEEEEEVEDMYSSSDDSDDSSDSVQTGSDDVKSESSDSQYSNPVENDPKSDELDSAIRSISYEEMNCENEILDDEVCDIHTHTLNQREIQSAVDSIL
ncbi:uncharacterized protein LOC112906799 [Agrilus planipennis]|uniref:Uncharacterized protein LOC108743884 n=1 Tax=Agrilus planipennis TaxID=224129 RepID=A0A1W4XG54_AGRPL|nr:uncharacterized protein LOC108743884 [Agrilus planipennis]XP_025837520.1 uncharacterized protein LOC112906799 [Agrilus planipennis]XP_025837521.1 uncharacterized protein LOC112906799 [Agrilus planipennis]